MGEVRWTEEASRWLAEIHDHIALDNPAAAQRTVLGIYELARTLTAFPERGYRYEAAFDRQVRILLYGHFRIAYLVKTSSDVEILGIFHGKLEILRYLK